MTISDTSGNSIIIEGDVIKLKLKGEDRTRLVGVMDKSARVLKITRNRTKHLHRKSDSYGFNHYILSNAKLFDKIILTDEHGSYLIEIKDILEKGRFLFFKEQGFEKQIFFPLREITKQKFDNFLF